MWFRWQAGRQGTGYKKMLLFQSKLLMCDVWLLSSEKGVSIPTHVDIVPGYDHYRANIVLKAPTKGGGLKAETWVVNRPRLKVFRSDHLHNVPEIIEGSRLVLSFGLCLKRKS